METPILKPVLGYSGVRPLTPLFPLIQTVLDSTVDTFSATVPDKLVFSALFDSGYMFCVA